MTNPRVYLKGKPKTFENIDQQATATLRNRPIPTDQEIDSMLNLADKIPDEYFRLRAKAIIGIIKIFGKRRIELSMLELADLKAENGMLYITFTIAKKRKYGLFQFMQFCEKHNPQMLEQPLPQIRKAWHEWQNTEQGYRIKKPRRPKATPLTDKYAQLIYEYYLHMQTKKKDAKFLFPSGKTVFGQSYLYNLDAALTGRQLYNIVKELNPQAWMHLFRKAKGEATARKYGRTLESVFMVKDTLDLSNDQTALHYVEQAVPKIETGET